MQRRKRLETKRRHRAGRKADDASSSAQSTSEQETVDESESSDGGFATSFDPLDENCNWLCAGPGPSDVILGRGRRTNNHAGNIRLRTMVEELKDVYVSSSKKEKTEITQRIVTSIQTNGRFLKETKIIGWVEVPDEVARIKVSHAFRDSYKVKRKAEDVNSIKTTQTLAGQKHSLPEPPFLNRPSQR